MVSLGKQGSKIKTLKEDRKRKEKIAKAVQDRMNTSTSMHNLERIHRDFLFGPKLLQDDSGNSTLNKSKIKEAPYKLKPDQPFGTSVSLHKEAKNYNTGSNITNYLDLNIIEQYAERELIYGSLKQRNRRLLIKFEIITFCMKKFIVFKVKK